MVFPPFLAALGTELGVFLSRAVVTWCGGMMKLVRVRLMHNSQQIASPTNLVSLDTSVRLVVDRAILTENVVQAHDTIDIFATMDHLSSQRSQLDAATCASLTVGDVWALGCFWVVHVRSRTERSSNSSTPGSSNDRSSSSHSSSSGSSVVPTFANNSLDKLMAASSCILPVASMSSRMDGVIFNQLLKWLASLSLGWDHCDSASDGLGYVLLKALSRALSFLYPFDHNGALGRRYVHLPPTLTAECLQVRACLHHCVICCRCQL